MSLARDLELREYVKTWKEDRQGPDTTLLRFVRHSFRYGPVMMLDIGSGEGANARELGVRGHTVVTVDKNPKTTAEYLQDILECEFWPQTYDLIYDVNTLCHVEYPPWEKIRGWLKPEGIFFSICPTALAPEFIAEGKDYTRRVDEIELRLMLQPFFKEVRIEWRSEPDYRHRKQLESWIVEARP